MALRIYKVIQNVLLIGVITVVTGLISMIVILDMNPYVVISGSMEPALPVGSVCIVDCQQRSPDEGDKEVVMEYLTAKERRLLQAYLKTLPS